jgi:hypothetical protein
MAPDRAIQQDITAEQDSMGLIEQAHMVRCLARCVKHSQANVADFQDIIVLEPPRYFEGRESTDSSIRKSRGQGSVTSSSL